MGTNLLEVEYIVSGRVLLMSHLVIDWGLITQTLAIFQLISWN